jgi:hypothetical protein
MGTNLAVVPFNVRGSKHVKMFLQRIDNCLDLRVIIGFGSKNFVQTWKVFEIR